MARILGMWAQLDRYLVLRIALPLLPLMVLLQAGNLESLTPELMGALTIVLAARVLAEGVLKGILHFFFGTVPLIGATVVCAGATPRNTWQFAIVYYATAGIGTILAAITELRERQ